MATDPTQRVWIFDLDGTLTLPAHDFDRIRAELGLRPVWPILEQLATSIASNQQPAQILTVANDIRKPLGWMLKASNNLGYGGLNTRIEEILDALPTSENISRTDGERMVDVIVAFLDDLKTLGETTGVDLGGESLAHVLSRTLKENLSHLLGNIAGFLDALETRDDAADEDLADNISQDFSRVQGYLSSLFPQLRCDIALLLVDVYARAARRQGSSRPPPADRPETLRPSTRPGQARPKPPPSDARSAPTGHRSNARAAPKPPAPPPNGSPPRPPTMAAGSPPTSPTPTSCS